MSGILTLIIVLSILVLLPIIVGNVFVFILRLWTKNQKFLRATKYVAFGVIFLLEFFLLAKVYIKRGVRARVKTPFYMDLSIEKSARLEQLDKLKAEGKINDEFYQKAVKYLESE